MEIGSFASGLLTGLREGVEAALIVSIVLAYLVRTGHGHQAGRIWLGIGAAIIMSVGLGLALFVSVGEFHEPYEQLYEAATMLLAAAVVTWMLFWMRRQAGSVAGDLRAAIDRALTDGNVWGLTALAFVAVIREGVETSLFLVGQASAASIGGGSAPLSVLVGAVVGLAVAAALGVGFYQGTRRINLGRFFRWTGVVLIFIAAGLVASAIHELVEIGVVTAGTGVAFDVGAILPSGSEAGNVLGMLLHALFGYSSAPEVAALVGWLAYLAVVLTTYLRPLAARPLRPAGSDPQEGRPSTAVPVEATVERGSGPEVASGR